MRIQTIQKWSLRVLAAIVTLIAIAIISLYILFTRSLDEAYGGRAKVADHAQFLIDAEATAISNVSVLSPDGTQMLPGRTVLLANRKIISIAQNTDIPDGVQIIDGRGQFLIPGLVDSHIHLHRSPNDLLLYVANGVTQVRSMNGSITDLELKRQIQNGRLGPHLYVSTPSMASADGFGHTFDEMVPGWMPESFFFWIMKTATNLQVSKDSGAAAKTARKFIQDGRDGVKLYGFLSMDSFRAILDVAEELDVPTAAHLPVAMALSELKTTKLQEIAHIEELVKALQREHNALQDQDDLSYLAFVDSRKEEIASDLFSNDIAVHSTLWFIESFQDQIHDLEAKLKTVELEYANPGLVEGNWSAASGLAPAGWLPGTNRFEAWAGQTPEEVAGSKKHWSDYERAHHILLDAMIEAGVTVLAGTDTGGWLVVPGFALHDELQTLQRRGMTPAQALRTATSAPAQRIRSNSGTIQIGHRADLLLLNKNPLEDIANTTSIDTVILDGEVFDRAQLDSILEAVDSANADSRTVDISAYQ